MNQQNHGDPFDPTRKVSLQLFRKGEGTPEALGVYEIEKNDILEEGKKKWQLEIEDLPKYYRDDNGNLQPYSYYVVEQNASIWHVEYSVDGEKYTIAANTVVTTEENDTIHLENSAWSYTLPSTGGPGTRFFTILGSVLILGAGVLLWWRRRSV